MDGWMDDTRDGRADERTEWMHACTGDSVCMASIDEEVYQNIRTRGQK